MPGNVRQDSEIAARQLKGRRVVASLIPFGA
jgi:hypothetical protein